MDPLPGRGIKARRITAQVEYRATSRVSWHDDPDGQVTRRGTAFLAARKPSAGSERGRARSRFAEHLLAAGLVVAGLAGGVAAATDPHDGRALLIATGLVGGAAALWLFVRFFWAGLLFVFAIRASLDHISPRSTDSGTVTPGAVVGLLVIAAGLIWLWQRHRAGTLTPLSRPAWALLLVSAAGLASSVGARFPFSSVSSSLRIFSSAVLLIVLQQIFREDPARIRPLLVAVFVSIIGPGLVGVMQLVGNKPVIAAYGPPIAVGRIEGTFVHPNAFATYLVILIPLGAAVMPHVHGRARLGLVVVTGGAGVSLLFTYARAAWVAAVVALLVVGFLQDRRIVVGVLAGAALVLLAVPSVIARLSDLTKSHPYGLTSADPNSLSWRFWYWGQVLPYAKQSPVTGIGLDMVQRINPEGLPPHSVWVQSFVETGVLGLLALLNLVVSIARGLFQARSRALDPIGRSIVVAAVAVSVGFLMQMFTENLLDQVVHQWYLLVPVSWALTVKHTDSSTWSKGRPPAPNGRVGHPSEETAQVPAAGAALRAATTS
jgi:putative inorganic carbon (HCO3(-)) transporter